MLFLHPFLGGKHNENTNNIKIMEPRVGPKNSFWGSTYSFFFGSTTSGKTVNEKIAMQTTEVYACVRIVAETIVSLPLHTYKCTETGKEKAIEHPIYHLIADEPNPEMTSFCLERHLWVIFYYVEMHTGLGFDGLMLYLNSQ